jgi:hypothetical protein
MAVQFGKTSFAAGEIAPALWGHVDLGKVEIAATTMRNMFVDYRGGARSRAGSLFLGQSKQRPFQSPPRIISWQFNNQQGFVLEFGDHYIRFYSAGARVVENPFVVVNVSNDTAVQVTTSAAHGYSIGDWVILQGVNGPVGLNLQDLVVLHVLSPTVFTIGNPDGVGINGSLYPAYTGGGTVSRVYTIASPYAASDLAWLKFVQSADVMSLTLVNPSGGSYPPQELRRMGPTNWSLVPAQFGTNVSPPQSITVTPTTLAGGGTPPALPAGYAYVVTTVDQKTGQESQASPIGTCTTGVDIAQTAGSNVITWTPSPSPGPIFYQVYRAPTAYNTGNSSAAQAPPAGSIFGLVGQAFGSQFVDANIIADFTRSPPQGNMPFAPGQILGILMGSSSGPWIVANVGINSSTGSGFVGTCVVENGGIVAVIVNNPGGGYLPSDTPFFTGTAGATANGTLMVGPQTGTNPGVVSYFQERRVYAKTSNLPDTYWMSQPGAFLNFDSSIPVRDSDAIEGTPWSEAVDGIEFMLTMPLGLLTFTGSGVWQVGAAGSIASSPAAVTPENQLAAPQSSVGCSSTVPPQKVNWDVLYVEASGDSVLDLTYQIWFNIYAGTEVSWHAKHLFTGYQIIQWTYARHPNRMLWLVRNDGTLLTFTFVKEQDVAGWGHHDTQGSYLSLCSVFEAPVNAVYTVVSRFVGGGHRYFIERFDNRYWPSVDVAWCVDAGVSTGQLSSPVTTVYGLSHLIGKPVVGLADGVPIGLPLSMRLLFPALSDLSFTSLVPDATGSVNLPFRAQRITLGLGFTAQLQSVYLTGGQPAIVGRRKALYALTAILEASLSPQAGGNQVDASAVAKVNVPWTLPPVPASPTIDPPPQPPTVSPGGQTVYPLFTGQIRLNVPSRFTRPSQGAVMQQLPVPLNVIGWALDVGPGDAPEDAIRLPQQQKEAA